MAADECPNIRCTTLTLAPAEIANEAAICLSACAVTRGKTGVVGSSPSFARAAAVQEIDAANPQRSSFPHLRSAVPSCNTSDPGPWGEASSPGEEEERLLDCRTAAVAGAGIRPMRVTNVPFRFPARSVTHAWTLDNVTSAIDVEPHRGRTWTRQADSTEWNADGFITPC